MSAATQTKIFGIKVGVDPKILVGGLIALAAFLFWYNSRGDETHTPTATTGDASRVVTPTALNPAPANVAATARRTTGRRRAQSNDRGTLRLRAVDPTRGDVDPVLRLDLLEKVRNVQPATGIRNLFTIGPAAQTAAQVPVPVRNIPVRAPVTQAPAINGMGPNSAAQAANIPLKYYGFAKPSMNGQPNEGFFLNGDDILVAREGELLQQQYLVVQLTPTSAKLEDTHIKLGQTLPVVPEAQDQQ
jgi:hypothetical protein